MQLSRNDFEQGLEAWLENPLSKTATEIRQVIAADWELKRQPFTGNLWLQRLSKVVIGHHHAALSTNASEDEGQQGVREPEDEAIANDESPSALRRVFVDLYVAYSSVYRVPMLCFRGRLQDGTVLSLDEVLQTSLFNVSRLEYPLNKLDEPTDADTNHEDTPSHFPTISQGEHPETGLPCFYLHPCETSAALQDVLSQSGDLRASQKDKTANLKCIEAWFMLVSTLVDIR